MNRTAGSNRDGSAFDKETIEAVWNKAAPIEGLLAFRKDRCGALICCAKYGETEQWGWEIDHVKPVARGGTDDLSNLQPLHWENNRHKADEWPEFTCKIGNEADKVVNVREAQ